LFLLLKGAKDLLWSWGSVLFLLLVGERVLPFVFYLPLVNGVLGCEKTVKTVFWRKIASESAVKWP